MYETKILSIISNCVEAIELPKKALKQRYQEGKILVGLMKMKEMNRNNYEVTLL